MTTTKMNIKQQQQQHGAISNTEEYSVEGMVLDRLLGQGGFGQVWEATYARNNRKLALKVLYKLNDCNDELQKETLQQEIHIWRLLSNKCVTSTKISAADAHIVPMYDLHTTLPGGHPAISMKLCSGGSLADHLYRRMVLTEPEAVNVARAMAKALSFCHANRVLHLDLKPANVMLPDYNSMDYSKCRLADFGLSYLLPEEGSQEYRYSDALECQYIVRNVVSGTPGYVAPEVITDSLYCRAADAWSLGALLLKTLTGHLPPGYKNRGFLISQLIAEFREWEGLHGDCWVDDYMRDFAVEAWWKLTPDARNAIKALLSPDPHLRLTISELLCHPWLAVAAAQAPDQEAHEQHKYIHDHLQPFHRGAAAVANINNFIPAH